MVASYMKNTPYPDLVVNAFKSVQAWKSLSMLLMGIIIAETFVVCWLFVHQSVLLMPQHLPASKNAIKIDLGSPYSPDYLTGVAKGDLYPLLNWTPDNIDAQYGLVIGRLSPALYDAQREVLLTEAKRHKDEGITQSFYVTRTFVNGPDVLVTGILVRSMGGREVLRGPEAYYISYTDNGNGVLLISAVRHPTEAEVSALQASAQKTAADAQKNAAAATAPAQSN